MKELLRMIQDMVDYGNGDYDLLCVIGLIEDRFLEAEKIEKEDFAVNFARWISDNYIITSDFLYMQNVTKEKMHTLHILEIYKREMFFR